MSGTGEEGIPRQPSDAHNDPMTPIDNDPGRNYTDDSADEGESGSIDRIGELNQGDEKQADPIVTHAGGGGPTDNEPYGDGKDGGKDGDKNAKPEIRAVTKPGKVICVAQGCNGRASKEKSSDMIATLKMNDMYEVDTIDEDQGVPRARLVNVPLTAGGTGACWVSTQRPGMGTDGASHVVLLAEYSEALLKSLKQSSGGLKLNEPNVYEGLNDQGYWKAITLLEYNPPENAYDTQGTWRARVDDTQKIWPIVYKQYIRPASTEKYVRHGWDGYDSRKDTGFIGIKNQGATCYLNSLLQCLFHLSYFRTGVYRMDTREDTERKESIPLALQSLFYDMEFREDSVSTKDLTASFGWDSGEAFQQQDVNEMLRILCDTLSEKMDKADAKNNTIQKLFKGIEANYVNCLDIDYTSSLDQPFFQINLAVRGKKDIYESLDEYCEKNVLDGDNKYCVERDGQPKAYERAERGTIFKVLPPVIIVVLRRFDFDLHLLRQVKINERFAFPAELDLSKYVAAPKAEGDGKAGASGLSDSGLPRANTLDVEQLVPQQYSLHSVMVHDGLSPGGGHYVCYVKPECEKQWYKFNDETVTKTAPENAIDGCFGGRDAFNPSRVLQQNAYCLIYIRKHVQDKIAYAPREEEKPLHLRERFAREEKQREEEEKREKERNKNVHITVVFEADIKAVGGAHQHLVSDKDMMALPEEQKFLFLREDTVATLKTRIAGLAAKKLDATEPRVRLWFAPLPISETPKSLKSDGSSITTAFYAHAYKEFLLFAQVLTDPAAVESLGHYDDILFVKEYDPRREQPTKYVGCLTVKFDSITYGGDNVEKVSAQINERLLGRKPAAPLCLWSEWALTTRSSYEGDKAALRYPADPILNYQSGCRGGCIVVCQATEDQAAREWIFSRQRHGTGAGEMPASLAGTEHPSAPQYYADGVQQCKVMFRPLKKSGEDKPGDDVVVPLRRDMHYPAVQKGLAEALGDGVDPAKIRFTRHDGYYARPQDLPQRMKHESGTLVTLDWMLPYSGDPIVHFEVLDITVEEMETRVALDINFTGAATELIRKGQLVLPRSKEITMRTVLEEALKMCPELDAKEPSELHLLHEYYSKVIDGGPFHIERDAPSSLTSVNRYGNWRIERTPSCVLRGAGDLKDGEKCHTVVCVHFKINQQWTNSTYVDCHSDPFTLAVKDEDGLDDIRLRMQKRLGFEEKKDGKRQGDDWKIHCYYDYKNHPLEAEDGPVWAQMQAVVDKAYRSTAYSVDPPCLAFEHAPPAPKKTTGGGGGGGGIKIREGGKSPKAEASKDK